MNTSFYLHIYIYTTRHLHNIPDANQKKRKKTTTPQITKILIDNITDFIARISIKINKTPESSTKL